jgi:hypothetical protein
MDEPCHGGPCGRLDYAPSQLVFHGCMSTITVEEVLLAADRALQRKED